MAEAVLRMGVKHVFEDKILVAEECNAGRCRSAARVRLRVSVQLYHNLFLVKAF